MNYTPTRQSGFSVTELHSRTKLTVILPVSMRLSPYSNQFELFPEGTYGRWMHCGLRRGAGQELTDAFCTVFERAVQNGGEFQATSGELYRDPQPATLEHLKSVMHPKIGRVSYTLAGNQAWPFPSRSIPETCTKPVHIRQTTDREQRHFAADFAARIGSKTRSRDTSISPDFCMKVMHPY